MGRVHKLQSSCSDRGNSRRREGTGFHQFLSSTTAQNTTGVPHCHLLQGKGSADGHLNYRLLSTCLLQGQPRSNLMQNCVLASRYKYK